MTSNKFGTGLLAIAAAISSSSGAESQTVPAPTLEPIKVGIIDAPVEKIMGNGSGVTIQRQSFVSPGLKEAVPYTAVHLTHGTVVASSFVQQAREIEKGRPIQIYSAQAFYQLPGSRGVDADGEPLPKRIGLDYAAATRALDWFKANGVRVVVTAFVTNENADMTKFMARARELDMVVFAGTNNDPIKFPPFPAKHPDAIAVTGTNLNLDYRFNRSMDGWVKFQADGSIPKGYSREEVENGSSFAVARAAAFGGFLVADDPMIRREQIVAVMNKAAGPNDNRVLDLSEWKTVNRFQVARREQGDLQKVAFLQKQRAGMSTR